jgi:hypothetical protein
MADTSSAVGSIDDAHIRIGGRVRLITPSPLLELLELRADTGTVIRRDTWDGYYIVRLDATAIRRHGDDPPEELVEVAEAADNLEAIDAPRVDSQSAQPETA